jgi:hypothetical protein
MKRLIQLGAGLNAYRLVFEPALVDDLRNVYLDAVAGHLNLADNRYLLDGGRFITAGWEHGPYKFHASSYGRSPLLWVSNDNMETYRVFERFFRALGVADDMKPLTDFDQAIVLYSGFFVVGDHLDEPAWHLDYRDGANAYTLMTPLFQLDCGHGRLLYRDDSASAGRFPLIGKYAYNLGEAVIFGDRFLHSTEPYGLTASLRVLVSLTFGSDKLDHWKVLEQTVGTQSNFMMLPCGHWRGACDCLRASELPQLGSADGPPS